MTTPRRRPLLTVGVSAAVLSISVVALLLPPVMGALTRDVDRLRAGQWWRLITPALVQSHGWGQLAFNLLGLAVVGAAVELRVGRRWWLAAVVLGGPGSVAVLTLWRPGDTGGGSSDAVAALVGVYAVLRVTGPRPRRRGDWAPELYAVFFAVYLTVFDVAGLTASILAGNAAVVGVGAAHRAVPERVRARGCLASVIIGGVVMAGDADGHGTGILAGLALGAWFCRRAAVSSGRDAPSRVTSGA